MKMKRCPVCKAICNRVAKHLVAAHPQVAAEQEAKVLEYYRNGMSARNIAKQKDIVYSGATSVVRVLRKHYTAEELESGRRERIGATVQANYDAGLMEEVKTINTERVKSEEGRAKNSAGLKSAYANGTRVSWSLGKTKYNDPSILSMSRKMSEMMKSRADSGALNTLFKSGPESPNWRGGITRINEDRRAEEGFSLGDRNLILRNSGYRCERCGKGAGQLEFESQLLGLERWRLECDHIIPIVGGGIADPVGNGQALCSECHLLKSLNELGRDDADVKRRYSGIDLAVLANQVGGVVSGGVVVVGDVRVGLVDLRTPADKHAMAQHRLENPGSIYFYRDEWINSSAIIKSMIAHRLGRTENVLYARKLKVVELSSDAGNEFFNKNHISGGTKSILNFGLADGDRICCAVSFRRPFTKSENTVIELARSSSLVGTSVVGGLSKLLKAASGKLTELGYTELLSYSDLRFGDGDSYTATGFTRAANTRPDYYYTDGYTRYGRFKFRAADGKTENEVAAEAGVWRVWGLGHARYTKRFLTNI